MFDRAGFIKAAKEQGKDYDEINAYLISQGVEKVSGVEKIILNEVIPKITAGVGGVTGAAAGTLGGPAAPITVPGMAAYGGFAGYGGGKVVNEMLKKIIGLQPETEQEYIPKALPEAGTAGLITGSSTELPNLLRTLLKPLESTKKAAMNVRDMSIGDKSLPTEQSQDTILQNMKNNKSYLMATPQAQQMSESRLGQYFGGVNPVQTISPGAGGVVNGNSMIQQSPEMSIKNMYEYLPSFEQSGRAYNESGEAGSAALSQGTNLASHAIRQYLTQNIPWTAQKANDVYGAVSKIQPGAQRIAKYTIPSYFAYQLMKKLFGGIGK